MDGNSGIGNSGKIERPAWVKNKKGDLIGGNFVVPKGKFSHFLGWDQPKAEGAGQSVSGADAIRGALQRKFEKVGEGATKHGNDFINMFVASGRRLREPGQTKEGLKDGVHSIHHALEANANHNMRYLEMQYKFQVASRSYTTISNLMKVRHESTRRAVQDAGK